MNKFLHDLPLFQYLNNQFNLPVKNQKESDIALNALLLFDYKLTNQF